MDSFACVQLSFCMHVQVTLCILYGVTMFYMTPSVGSTLGSGCIGVVKHFVTLAVLLFGGINSHFSNVTWKDYSNIQIPDIPHDACTYQTLSHRIAYNTHIFLDVFAVHL